MDRRRNGSGIRTAIRETGNVSPVSVFTPLTELTANQQGRRRSGGREKGRGRVGRRSEMNDLI